MSRPRVLIEDWLPIAEIGIESQRERSTVSAYPPIYFLHVWWARRPLVATRAAVLGSVLPSWSPGWPDDLLDRFPSETDFRDWFVKLLGIRGDPVEARKRIRRANELGIKLDRAYDGPRAFSVTPEPADFLLFERLINVRWGTKDIRVADPMAGGGSIPFEALRFGLRTSANELNPVAALILEATLDFPARYGTELSSAFDRWADEWSSRVKRKLKSYFPVDSQESIQAYIFARTVQCPETGKPVPLVPDWKLLRRGNGVSLRPISGPTQDEAAFELLRDGGMNGPDPIPGSVARGEGRSIWTDATIPSSYIKSEAQAGRMGDCLLAVALKERGGIGFRLATPDDREALAAATSEARSHREMWEVGNLIPTERYPDSATDMRPHHYGMAKWSDFFSDRQLLSVATYVETLRDLEREIVKDSGPEMARAILSLGALAIGKVVNYNSRLSSWNAGTGRVRSVFDRHDFSFKWTYAEFDSARNLLPWATAQVSKAFRQLAELEEPSRLTLFGDTPARAAELVDIVQGDAASLPYQDRSIHALVVDPPYYDNVQYAELSDFFYVWEKRTVGHLYPEFFATELSDKATEAVANPARFDALDKKRAKDLAKADYERKMTRVFAEANRVLRDDGVLTVMFTHKKVEAWDTLGQSLIEAGFEIESSWPVHTESEHSLHQARKAAAASTILLTCRKRTEEREPAWWDDLQREVRRVAREKAEEFLAAGIDGVDLYISTFGPTLSVISRQWPVYTSDVDPETGEPRPLRPEEALDLAREEVADLRRRGLLLGRDVEFDPVTDWYLLAWDAFGAVEFPYDEARKLALALGLDLDGELVKLKVVSKKASSVILQEPKQRRRPGLADPEETSFVRLLDPAHALMVAYQEDGIRGAESFLKRTRLGSDVRFQAFLQALINAIPRTKLKGKFARPEAAALDGLAVLFPDLVFPDEPEIALEPTQAVFDLGAGGSDDDDPSDEDIAEDD